MLDSLAKYVVYDLLNLSPSSNLSGALELFIYESIKIFLLLAVIIFVISFIRSFFPPEKTRGILSHNKEFIGNAFSMAVTPLSLPEMIILRRVLKVRLLAVFVGIMTVTIMAVGYLFNTIM